MTTELLMLVRPNGRTYRARMPGLRARAWENPDATPDTAGVIVFGTIDPEAARTLAAESCTYWYGEGELTNPRPGWFRDAFRGGERTWVEDEARGAPGVSFTWD